MKIDRQSSNYIYGAVMRWMSMERLFGDIRPFGPLVKSDNYSSSDGGTVITYKVKLDLSSDADSLNKDEIKSDIADSLGISVESVDDIVDIDNTTHMPITGTGASNIFEDVTGLQPDETTVNYNQDKIVFIFDAKVLVSDGKLNKVKDRLENSIGEEVIDVIVE